MSTITSERRTPAPTGIVDRDGNPALRRHHPIQTFVQDYEWIHTGVGIAGNSLFFAGSVLFLWESTKTVGVWMFIVGALFMLIGSVGSAIVKLSDGD